MYQVSLDDLVAKTTTPIQINENNVSSLFQCDLTTFTNAFNMLKVNGLILPCNPSHLELSGITFLASLIREKK